MQKSHTVVWDISSDLLKNDLMNAEVALMQ